MATPTLVRGQWLSSEALTRPVVDGEERGGMVAREVFAGGDQSFASLAVRGEHVRGIRRRGRERRKKGEGEHMVEGEEGIVFGFVMCACYELFCTTVVQGVSVISDHRRKQSGCILPSLNHDVLKEVLDEALITKDYTRASRYIRTYTCPTPTVLINLQKQYSCMSRCCCCVVCSFLRMFFSHSSLLNGSFLSRWFHTSCDVITKWTPTVCTAYFTTPNILFGNTVVTLSVLSLT